METLGAALVGTGKLLTSFIFSRIAALVNSRGNLKALQKEMAKLTNQKNVIIEDIQLAKTEGKFPTAQVSEWLKDAEGTEHEVNLMLEKGLNDGTALSGCNLSCSLRTRYQQGKRVAKKLDKVKQLVNSCTFQTVVADRKLPTTIAVVKMQVPSLMGQRAASEMLQQLLEFLNDDGIKRIAVWGMGGVGKTTLVKNLNNNLEFSTMTESFDMIIWLPVSKDLDLRRLQSQIAERLNLELEAGESTQGRATGLRQKLMMKKKFLLILDDVWEKIDLDAVGIPQGDDHPICKILLTTRSFDVCREMTTDVEIKVDVLSEEEAWNLFAQSAGPVVESEGIEPLARAIARECRGLPLAVKAMGKSMRAQTMTELWKNALCTLQRLAPNFTSIEKEVFLPLKLSYNSLQSKILQQCFLYCSLYPQNFSIKVSELVQCWIADGLLDGNQALEESFNNGIALVENLEDCSLLEHGEGIGTVKMHDVVRDVAIWISSIETECGFFSQSGISVSEMPKKLQKSSRRVSYMNNMIESLPGHLLGCSDLTVLLLQGNPLKKIPDRFFREVRALRVLNLSGTPITSLPSSLFQLGELRALLLRNCCSLGKLPALGALYKLEVLDLFGTRLRELTKEMRKLSNLKELNLSHTHHLEKIEAGTISGLSSLEALDMSFSAYGWDVKCNVEGQRAAFDELLSLEHLSVLHIRLDRVDCLALDFPWLRRLRRFNIQISPRSCDSNYLPTQHDEKRVILRGVDLFEKGIVGLVCNASALDLLTCGGMSGLSEIVGQKNCANLAGLKSLTITSCDWITKLMCGEKTPQSMLPGLEHLSLNHLNNLETILDGMILNEGCLGRLRTLEVVDCPRLKKLISYALIQQLQNLEEVKVSFCESIQCIFAGMFSNEALPKLKAIELRDLINLRMICSITRAWPALEKIEVSNCPMLGELPLSVSSAITIKTIRGDLKWWDKLRWENDEIKVCLQRQFQSCADTTSLARKDRWA